MFEIIKNYSQYLDKKENLLKLQNEERLKMEKDQSKKRDDLEIMLKKEIKDFEEYQKLQREKLEKENYEIIYLFLQYFSKEKDRNLQEKEVNIIPLNEDQDNLNDKKKEENKNKKIILKMKKKSLILKILKKDIEMKKMIQKIYELVHLPFNKKELLNYLIIF